MPELKERDRSPPPELLAIPETKKDEVIEALQKALTKENDARKEERFVWLLSVMLLFDVFTFPDMKTWGGPIAVGFIQFVVLIVLGRKWQVDEIWKLTEKVLDKWDGCPAACTFLIPSGKEKLSSISMRRKATYCSASERVPCSSCVASLPSRRRE